MINKNLTKRERVELALSREFYSNTLESLLGNSWAMFYLMLGGRETGKSYAVTKKFVKQWRKYKRPFYWLRLSKTSVSSLLENNAMKLIDPDIRREFNLNIKTLGNDVYEIKESEPDKNGKKKIVSMELMARVLDIATFYNDKGNGYFDKDFLDDPNMYYNICLDEMNREKCEKNSFDIVYAFANQLENIIRSTKKRVRIICIGNTLEEASDLMCAFNFLPDKFGRFKIKNKKAVVEYIENNDAYKKRREGTAMDILLGDNCTITNEIKPDLSLIHKGRLNKPTYIVKFSKDKSQWFTIWDSNVIARYNNESKSVICMRPYIDGYYDDDIMMNVVNNFDHRAYLYKDLITFKLFQKNINLLKPRGN